MTKSQVFLLHPLKRGACDENVGPEKFIYIFVTVPAFDIEALYDTGQLKRQCADPIQQNLLLYLCPLSGKTAQCTF